MSKWLVISAALAACGGGAKHDPTTAPPPPARDGGKVEPTPSAAGVRMIGGELVLPHGIQFTREGDFDQASLDSLVVLASYLETHPDLTLLRIEGHLAAGVADEDPINVSGGEALAVGVYLREHGIDCKRLVIAAFGTTKPRTNTSADTRITLVPATLRGVAIGGMPVDGSAPAAVDACP